MFESCFFQFKLCLEINNTMETVVDSSNVGFEYMDVGRWRFRLLCCEDGNDGMVKHFTD